MAERQKRPTLTCQSCGFALHRCMACGAIGCRHSEGWEVCPAQMFHKQYCRACGARAKTREVKATTPRDALVARLLTTVNTNR